MRLSSPPSTRFSRSPSGAPPFEWATSGALSTRLAARSSRFDEADPFHGGLALVTVADAAFYIDARGGRVFGAGAPVH